MDFTSFEVAKILGVSDSTIINYVNSKKLNFVSRDKKTGQYKFSNKNTEEYIKKHPPEPRVLTIANIKGGVGKSTISIMLSTTLKYFGFKVLHVDIDPQGNSTKFFNGSAIPETTPSIFDIFNHNTSEVPIYKNKKLDIDFIPASLKFSIISKRDDLKTVLSLSSFLREHKKDYDFVIIDTPPNIQSPVEGALIASDFALFVADPRDWAYDGIRLIAEIIEDLNSGYQREGKCDIIGILLNKFDKRHNIDNIFAEQLKKAIEEVQILNTKLPRSVKYEEVLILKESFFGNHLLDKHKTPIKNLTLEILNEAKYKK